MTIRGVLIGPDTNKKRKEQAEIIGSIFYSRTQDLSWKSLLKFLFPVAGEGRPPIAVTLPMFENISIDESQKGNYAQYDLIGRPGQLFTYTGAASRRIKLSFPLTLPHIKANVAERWGQSRSFLQRDDALLRDRMEKGYVTLSEQGQKGLKHVENLHGNVRQFLTENSDYLRRNPKDLQEYLASVAGIESEAVSEIIAAAEVDTQKVLLWWINIIRSSVVNNVQLFTLGPPIIVLRHGPLYQDVKCICENYKITPMDEAGLETTLMPRRLMISLDLAEIRIGDFGEYKYGHVVKGDNITGWESVFEEGTMDPGITQVGGDIIF